MDYERLTASYWGDQVERMRKVLNGIIQRTQAALPGRVVPDQDELAIGTGRQLLASVMFIDISAFSSRPSGSYEQQEVLLRVLNFYFSEMIRIAEDYGGTVEKNTGDGLMAYFEDNGGDPPEHGSKRAVAAALTMMYANDKAINPVLTQSGIPEIQFRVTIDYGPVTIAQLGAARRFGGLVAIGATANIASKMLTDAAPRDILIGEDVFKKLPPAWQQYCNIHKTETGWIYLNTGLPYWFYKYTGRWKDAPQ